MSDDWSQNKLSVNTKQVLGNIFHELDSDHVQEAFDMHITLVRNASSEVCFLSIELHFIHIRIPLIRLLDLSLVSND